MQNQKSSTILRGPAAADRVARAQAWLEERPGRALLVIASTLGAARQLLRRAAARAGAGFGWQPATLARLAADWAAPALAARGLAPATGLSLEAACARTVHRLRVEGRLGRLAAIGDRPGLTRALRDTLVEARLAGASLPAPLGDAETVLAEELSRAGLADRAEVLRAATAACRAFPGVLLLDVEIAGRLEEAFVAELCARAGEVLATVPAMERVAVPGTVVDLAPSSAMGRLAAALFDGGAHVPEAEATILSAPGESRECVEIVRRVRAEAARGTRFDRMAILLRAPAAYRVPLEEALRRGGVPAHFAAGTRRPDPAGRAFLSLLACAAEGLSARRFSEYLSIGELPEHAAPPDWVPPDDVDARPEDDDEEAEPVETNAVRAPRHWERLLVEAAVIGGRERWARRLAGLLMKRELAIAAAEDATEAEALARRRAELVRLRDFALPIVDALAGLPRAASWAEWLDALRALAGRALGRPQRVLAILAELAPMGAVGPVGLDEVRLVLGPRLVEAAVPPPARAAGRILVAPLDAARGLEVDVVFLPGLAEKVFPPKLDGDPLLSDEERAPRGLRTMDDQLAAERMLLRLAVGAAAQRVVGTYPRLDLQKGRARVPSLYALELARARSGRLPTADELAGEAEREGGAHLAWPAPVDPAQAIDEAELDLAVVRAHLSSPRRGIARYALDANPTLAASLRLRYQRDTAKWSRADGLLGGPAAATALEPEGLARRSFSATALQKYPTCPYQFYLYAVQRLAPPDSADPVEQIDPLDRGSLVHEVLYQAGSELAAAGLAPPTAARLGEAQEILDRIFAATEARWRDDLAPPIPRVWEDAMAQVRADLREWLRRETGQQGWRPWRFELAFGLEQHREGRDPESRVEPVPLACGLKLRGSIDAVERRADGALRATDFKTGKDRTRRGMIVGGGQTLQPVLYALALEQLFAGTPVVGGRLYFATHAGNYREVEVRLDDSARQAAELVARTIGEALAVAHFPAAPSEEACPRCDYLGVCGPGADERARKKPGLEALYKLRSHR